MKIFLQIYILLFWTFSPYAKKCACNMHVTTNYMHVMVNMHVTLLLHACCTGVGNGSACTMHVVRVLSNMHVGSACNVHVVRVLE